MSTLPAPVPGSASVPLGDGAVVYHPGAGEIVVLNAAGALVWSACCDGLGREQLLDDLHAATARPRAELEAEVDAYVEELRRDGLVGGRQEAPADIWVRDEPDGGGPLRQRFAVLGEVVEVRTSSGWLHEHAARLCADLRTDEAPTRWMVVEEEPGGRVRIDGPRVGWRSHESLDALLAALPSELNVVATSWVDGVALHAGGVRRPDGAVVALAGESGAGKSTLVGALVRAGWDYLGDEAVGLLPDLRVVGYPKPLSLDATSRRLLGLPPSTWDERTDLPVGELRTGVRTLAGTADPLAAVVVPRRRDQPGAAVRTADGPEALELVAGHALNLPRAGATGLAAVVRASEAVPCLHLAHGDLDSAVAALEALALP